MFPRRRNRNFALYSLEPLINSRSARKSSTLTEIPSFSCTVCHCQLNGVEPLHQHLSSAGHIRRVEIKKAVLRSQSSQLSDSVTNLYCTSQYNLVQHETNSTHLSTENKEIQVDLNPLGLGDGIQILPFSKAAVPGFAKSFEVSGLTQDVNILQKINLPAVEMDAFSWKLGKGPNGEAYVMTGDRGFCYVCNLELTSQQHCRQHVQGNKHIKKDKDITSLLNSQTENSQLLNSMQGTLHPEQNVRVVNNGGLNRNFYDFLGPGGHCFVCNVIFTSAQLANEHIAGQKHKKKTASVSLLEITDHKSSEVISSGQSAGIIANLGLPGAVSSSGINSSQTAGEGFNVDHIPSILSSSIQLSQVGLQHLGYIPVDVNSAPISGHTSAGVKMQEYTLSDVITAGNTTGATSSMDRPGQATDPISTKALNPGLAYNFITSNNIGSRMFSGNISPHIASSGTISPHIASSGSILPHVASSGSLLPHIAPFGNISPYMANTGQITNYSASSEVSLAPPSSSRGPNGEAYIMNGNRGYCYVCKLLLTSESHAKSHLTGKKHKKKNWEGMVNGNAVNTSADGIVPMDNSRVLMCRICNVPFSSHENARQHLMSDKHRKKLSYTPSYPGVENLQETNAEPSGAMNVNQPLVYTSAPSGFKLHDFIGEVPFSFENNEQIDQILAPNEEFWKGLNTKPYYMNGNRGACFVCNIELTSPQHCRQHIEGKEHIKKEREFINAKLQEILDPEQTPVMKVYSPLTSTQGNSHDHSTDDPGQTQVMKVYESAVPFTSAQGNSHESAVPFTSAQGNSHESAVPFTSAQGNSHESAVPFTSAQGNSHESAVPFTSAQGNSHESAVPFTSAQGNSHESAVPFTSAQGNSHESAVPFTSAQGNSHSHSTDGANILGNAELQVNGLHLLPPNREKRTGANTEPYVMWGDRGACYVCNVELTSQQLCRQHIQGKKHIKKVNELSSQRLHEIVDPNALEKIAESQDRNETVDPKPADTEKVAQPNDHNETTHSNPELSFLSQCKKVLGRFENSMLDSTGTFPHYSTQSMPPLQYSNITREGYSNTEANLGTRTNMPESIQTQVVESIKCETSWSPLSSLNIESHPGTHNKPENNQTQAESHLGTRTNMPENNQTQADSHLSAHNNMIENNQTQTESQFDTHMPENNLLNTESHLGTRNDMIENNPTQTESHLGTRNDMPENNLLNTESHLGTRNDMPENNQTLVESSQSETLWSPLLSPNTVLSSNTSAAVLNGPDSNLMIKIDTHEQSSSTNSNIQAKDKLQSGNLSSQQEEPLKVVDKEIEVNSNDYDEQDNAGFSITDNNLQPSDVNVTKKSLLANIKVENSQQVADMPASEDRKYRTDLMLQPDETQRKHHQNVDPSSGSHLQSAQDTRLLAGVTSHFQVLSLSNDRLTSLTRNISADPLTQPQLDDIQLTTQQHFDPCSSSSNLQQTPNRTSQQNFDPHLSDLQQTPTNTFQQHFYPHSSSSDLQETPNKMLLNFIPSLSQNLPPNNSLTNPIANKSVPFHFNGSSGYCYCCSVELTSLQHANQHLYGQKHKKRSEQWQLTSALQNGPSQQTPPPPDQPVHQPSEDTSYYFNGDRGFCRACNIELSSLQHAQQHLHGKPHKRTKERVNKSQNGIVFPLNCQACGKIFTGQESAHQHFTSAKHKSKAEALNESVVLSVVDGGRVIMKDGQVWHVCDICKVAMNTREQFLFHKESSKHKRECENSKSRNSVSEDGPVELTNNVIMPDPSNYIFRTSSHTNSSRASSVETVQDELDAAAFRSMQAKFEEHQIQDEANRQRVLDENRQYLMYGQAPVISQDLSKDASSGQLMVRQDNPVIAGSGQLPVSQFYPVVSGSGQPPASQFNPVVSSSGQLPVSQFIPVVPVSGQLPVNQFIPVVPVSGQLPVNQFSPVVSGSGQPPVTRYNPVVSGSGQLPVTRYSPAVSDSGQPLFIQDIPKTTVSDYSRQQACLPSAQGTSGGSQMYEDVWKSLRADSGQNAGLDFTTSPLARGTTSFSHSSGGNAKSGNGADAHISDPHSRLINRDGTELFSMEDNNIEDDLNAGQNHLNSTTDDDSFSNSHNLGNMIIKPTGRQSKGRSRGNDKKNFYLVKQELDEFDDGCEEERDDLNIIEEMPPEVAAPMTPPAPPMRSCKPGFRYYCGICNKHMNTRETYENHIKGKYHIIMLSNHPAPTRKLEPICKVNRNEGDILSRMCSIINKELKIVPRVYQIELVLKAMKGDCIIYLPTGTGKTLVAVLTMGLMLQENPSRPVLFLVDKVLLVMQQAQYIIRHFAGTLFQRQDGEFGSPLVTRELQVKPICGGLTTKTDLPIWKHDIVVTTAAYCANMLDRGQIRWEDFSLVVLDEVHHCGKGHPYHRLMSTYHCSLPEPARAKVLGLTASPAGKSTVEQTYVMLKSLLANLGGASVAVVEENNACLDLFQSLTKVKPVCVPMSSKEKDFKAHLLQYFILCYSQLALMTNNLHSNEPPCSFFLDALRKPGDTEVAAQLAQKFIKDPEPLSEVLDAIYKARCIDEADVTGRNRFDNLRLHICQLLLIIPEVGSGADIEELLVHLSPSGITEEFKKMGLPCDQIYQRVTRFANDGNNDLTMFSKLAETLQDPDVINWSDTSSRALVLVRERKRARQYCLKLRAHPMVEKKNLRVGHIVGHGKGAKDGGMDVKKQRRVFDNHEKYHILVATSIMEEGIDIQALQLVVCMNPPNSLRALVQMRGRARREGSHFVVLCSTEEDVDKLNSLQKQEQNMQEAAKRCLEESK